MSNIIETDCSPCLVQNTTMKQSIQHLSNLIMYLDVVDADLLIIPEIDSSIISFHVQQIIIHLFIIERFEIVSYPKKRFKPETCQIITNSLTICITNLSKLLKLHHSDYNTFSLKVGLLCSYFCYQFFCWRVLIPSETEDEIDVLELSIFLVKNYSKWIYSVENQYLAQILSHLNEKNKITRIIYNLEALCFMFAARRDGKYTKNWNDILSVMLFNHKYDDCKSSRVIITNFLTSCAFRDTFKFEQYQFPKHFVLVVYGSLLLILKKSLKEGEYVSSDLIIAITEWFSNQIIDWNQSNQTICQITKLFYPSKMLCHWWNRCLDEDVVDKLESKVLYNTEFAYIDFHFVGLTIIRFLVMCDEWDIMLKIISKYDQTQKKLFFETQLQDDHHITNFEPAVDVSPTLKAVVTSSQTEKDRKLFTKTMILHQKKRHLQPEILNRFSRNKNRRHNKRIKQKISIPVLKQKLNQFPAFKKVIEAECGMKFRGTSDLDNGDNYNITMQWKNIILQKVCNRCHVRNKKLHKCKQCRKVYYCSRMCQKLDWNIYSHNLTCSSLT